MPRTTWQENIWRASARKDGLLAHVKSQAILPNGGTYTVCEPANAEDSCLSIYWMRASKAASKAEQ